MNKLHEIIDLLVMLYIFFSICHLLFLKPSVLRLISNWFHYVTYKMASFFSKLWSLTAAHSWVVTNMIIVLKLTSLPLLSGNIYQNSINVPFNFILISLCRGFLMAVLQICVTNFYTFYIPLGIPLFRVLLVLFGQWAPLETSSLGRS